MSRAPSYQVASRSGCHASAETQDTGNGADAQTSQSQHVLEVQPALRTERTQTANKPAKATPERLPASDSDSDIGHLHPVECPAYGVPVGSAGSHTFILWHRHVQ